MKVSLACEPTRGVWHVQIADGGSWRPVPIPRHASSHIAEAIAYANMPSATSVTVVPWPDSPVIE